MGLDCVVHRALPGDGGERDREGESTGDELIGAISKKSLPPFFLFFILAPAPSPLPPPPLPTHNAPTRAVERRWEKQRRRRGGGVNQARARAGALNFGPRLVTLPLPRVFLSFHQPSPPYSMDASLLSRLLMEACKVGTETGRGARSASCGVVWLAACAAPLQQRARPLQPDAACLTVRLR